jgi:hypothetical protein
MVPDRISSYWVLIEPLFSSIDMGSGPQEFSDSISLIPRPNVLLFAAHMCLAEVHNGGFLQLFWNSTGVVVPEAEEGFRVIGMPRMADIVEKAAHLLGSPYPRDREGRWDALLEASGRKPREMKRIFKKQENLYLAFAEATSSLPLNNLDNQFWENAMTENGGFQDAATRYAQTVHLVVECQQVVPIQACP